MIKDWQELVKLTGNREIIVKKISLKADDIAIEGEFELPPLARLSQNDQVFVAAFISCHGSIKQMEKIFGVSYPTIKNRLNAITRQLDLVRIDSGAETSSILDRLDSGEIDVAEALKMLSDDKNQ